MAKVKNKTHKGLSKVSKKHGNGKIQLTTAGGSHKSGKKSRKTVRKLEKIREQLLPIFYGRGVPRL